MNKLIKFGLLVVSNLGLLPLAYLGVTHGSSYGLELGVFLVVLLVVANISIIKTK